MKIPAYHIDAFAGGVFAGNPAMVCLLERWLVDEMLQLVAAENCLPVTAFLVQQEDHHELRWFTPAVELKLCGHGTLAAAAVLFDTLDAPKESLNFKTVAGIFQVIRDGELLVLDFPIREAVPCSVKPEDLVQALGREPIEILKAQNYLAVYEDEADIRAIAPDMRLLNEVDCVGAIVTAKGKDSDFVSRYFAPRLGISEDSATGSSHCTLAPYWAKKLGKRKLHALQLSQRGGEMWCEFLDDKVRIGAKTARYAEGFLSV